jgi:hypothetical protein
VPDSCRGRQEHPQEGPESLDRSLSGASIVIGLRRYAVETILCTL